MDITAIKSTLYGKFDSKVAAMLSFLLFGLLLTALFGYFHVSQWQGWNRDFISMTGEQSAQSQKVVKYAMRAASGSDDAFLPLADSRDHFGQLLKEMKNGNSATGLPASPLEASAALDNVENTWQSLREKADSILTSRNEILFMNEFVQDMNELLPRVHAKSTEVTRLMVRKGANADQVEFAGRQEMLAERMQNNTHKLLEGGTVSATAMEQFGNDVATFDSVVTALLEGSERKGITAVNSPEIRADLAKVAELFQPVTTQVDAVMATASQLLPALGSAEELPAASDKLSESIATLVSVYAKNPGMLSVGGVAIGPWFILAAGIAAVATLILLGLQFVRAARERVRESVTQNNQNQEAIIRLLDELGDLANGDLTVQATVTGDITGAIADSVNYAIDALRALVTTINETSNSVSGAADESRQTAAHLREVSEGQAQQISTADLAVREMAEATRHMDQAATETSDVVTRSVDLAGKGADAVRSTIDAMGRTREQIQETSKRIKRLGESSQEIGDIVELIDEIAEQTNILALNAAIQAAMAGESGRGFAVVADEVQRLAERSSNATRQIEVLVKTIQSDTSEAVVSMEQSTAGVVRAAKLADDAGDALREIGEVSGNISTLTKEISNLAQSQKTSADGVTETMSAILATTGETAESTTRTAESVGNLAELATELEGSVAGFKLPA